MGSCVSGKSNQPKNMQTRGTINILYGTTYGMSAKLAFSMASEARHKGYIPKVQSVGDFPFEELQSATVPVLFLLSTYGTGGPTADARGFFDSLMKSDVNLNNLKYGIYGLGNSTFEEFCGMSVKCDAKLQELKANRLFELRKGDAEKQTTESEFAEWKKSIWVELEKLCPLMEMTQQQIMELSSTFKLKELQNDATEILPLIDNSTDIKNYSAQVQQYLDCQEMNIKEIQGLKNCQGNDQTYFVSLQSQNNQDIQYQTAGNVQIYAENDQQSIDEICNILKLNKNMKFDIEMKQQSAKKLFPTPISVNSFLQKFCDIHGPISKSLLYSFAECMLDTQQKKNLQELTSYENDEKFQKEIFEQKESLLSLLRKHKVNMPLQQLIDLSQRIPPRQYTISCSNQVKPQKIELTITILYEDGKYGLFTGFLNNLAKNYQDKTLRLNPVSSPFKFPEDTTIPIITVSTGAGIGPFMAFCEEKLAKKTQNEIHFYFGCRNKKDDYIYEDRIEEFQQKGAINQLHVAFSREQSVKQYVQHKLIENKNQVSDILFKRSGKLYICGSQKMSDDVCKAIGQIMTETQGIASYLTMSKISRMKNDGVILTEILK